MQRREILQNISDISSLFARVRTKLSQFWKSNFHTKAGATSKGHVSLAEMTNCTLCVMRIFCSASPASSSAVTLLTCSYEFHPSLNCKEDSVRFGKYVYLVESVWRFCFVGCSCENLIVSCSSVIQWNETCEGGAI